MAIQDYSFYPGGYASRVRRFILSATGVLAGQVLVRQATAGNSGEVAAPSAVTAATDALGLAMHNGTYSTTQTDFDGFPDNEEGTVAVIADPFGVYAFRASGSATSGTALATTAPANVLVQETTDATGLIITDDVVGTASMVGGLIFGKTGNNVGIARRITVHNNGVDTRVTVPFPRSLVAADSFARFPWSASIENVQLTTDFKEANAIIATGTGAPFRVVDLDYDPVMNEAIVHCIAIDHWYNPLS